MSVAMLTVITLTHSMRRMTVFLISLPAIFPLSVCKTTKTNFFQNARRGNCNRLKAPQCLFRSRSPSLLIGLKRTSPPVPMGTPVLHGPMNVLAIAGRALGWPSNPIGQFPFMPAAITLEFSHFRHFDNTSFNSQSFSIYEGICHLFVGGLYDSAEGRPGNAHLFRCLFMVEAFIVGQTNRLEFIHG